MPRPGPHGGKPQKAKDSKKALKDLFCYCRKYIPFIFLSIILGLVSTIVRLIGPNKLSEITNLILEGISGTINLNGIFTICKFLATLYISSLIFGYFQNFIMGEITQKICSSLRTNINKKITKIQLKYFDNTKFGDILSRVTNDVDTIGETLNNSIGSFVSSITLFLGSLFMMFKTNWMMALTAVFTTLIGMSLLSAIMKNSQKYFSKQQKDLGRINGHIEEIFSGHKVIKAYNGEENAEKTFNELNNELYTSVWKAQFLSGLMGPLMGFIGNFGYVCVCILGAILTKNNIISFGVIVSFMIYIRLFTNPLESLAQIFTSLQSTLAASERVFSFLDEEELSDESHKTNKLEKISGEVEFKNVQFGYNPEKLIIKDFNAKVKPGQKIAIVGPTGAGKTTIVNLLMRFYETNKGDILIDGTSIKDITRENLHDLFGMVLQDTWIFDGTLRENLVYTEENITDEKLDEICKSVGLSHYVKTLPNGYDTEFNEQTTLSAGQKQLVTIARAMIKNAPLLILDEATSSIDTRTELLVQNAMDKLMEKRTSFVIAHRLSTIKNADLILVMKNGDIIESGNHEELLNKNGFYAELYNSQFEEVED